MTSRITSLHQILEVTPDDDDNVQVTVTLPADLFYDYIGLLESLSGFVNAINHQKHTAKLRAASDLTKESFQFKSAYQKRIVKDYDLAAGGEIHESCYQTRLPKIYRHSRRNTK